MRALSRLVSRLAPLLLAGCESLTGGGTTVTVSPAAYPLYYTGTAQLTATVTDGGGTVRTDVPVRWTSSDTTIVAVSPTGLVTGRNLGRVTITATAGKARGTATVLVNAFDSSRLALGGMFSCAVSIFKETAGATYCWGANERGQLGVRGAVRDTLGKPTEAVETAGPTTTGVAHVCTLVGFPGGSNAFCWGANEAGQLGDGTTTDRPPITRVSGGLVFTQVSAGGAHTCGVAQRRAYCWGSNAFGQLGTGGTANSLVPVAVSGGLAFDSVSAGLEHTCAITPDQRAYCWGRNQSGQIGSGSATDSPVPVAGGLRFRQVSAGGDHTCALTPADLAYCWGGNAEGQLGTSGTAGSTVPTAVAGGLTFYELDAGSGVTCGVGKGAQVLHAYCWGSNRAGQLGRGPGPNSPVPLELPFEDRDQYRDQYTTIAVGLRAGGLPGHVCARRSTIIFCWGANDKQQLGLGVPGPDRCAGGLPCATVPLPVQSERRP